MFFASQTCLPQPMDHGSRPRWCLYPRQRRGVVGEVQGYWHTPFIGWAEEVGKEGDGPRPGTCQAIHGCAITERDSFACDMGTWRGAVHGTGGGPSKRTTKAEYHHDSGPTAGWRASVLAGCKGAARRGLEGPEPISGASQGAVWGESITKVPRRQSCGCIRAWNKVLMVDGTLGSEHEWRRVPARAPPFGPCTCVQVGGGGCHRPLGSVQGRRGVVGRTWNPRASRRSGPGVKRWVEGASQFVLGRLGKNRNKKGRL